MKSCQAQNKHIKGLIFYAHMYVFGVNMSDQSGSRASNVGLPLWVTHLPQTKHLKLHFDSTPSASHRPQTACDGRRAARAFFSLDKNIGAQRMMDRADWHGWTTFPCRRAWWITRISSALWKFLPVSLPKWTLLAQSQLNYRFAAGTNWLSVKWESGLIKKKKKINK